ncbi:hypothetical protein AALA54_06020 [Oscillospiraceae bacterium 44-34]
MARKKKKNAEVEEEEIQGGKKKKKGKKKLVILLLGLLLIAAAAFVVVRVVLPKLSGGGGEEEEMGAPPKKGITAYTIGEESVPSLDTILEEADGKLIANRGPGKVIQKDEETGEEVETELYTYIYELEGYAAVVNRYLDLMMGEEQGFVLADESYLILEERPELADEEGAMILARASTQEGHLFQLVIGWSQANNNLAVRVSAPEGTLRRPEPEKEQQPASRSEHLNTLRDMLPSQLGLSGETMGEYDIYALQGFVTINDMLCRPIHIYEKFGAGKLEAIVYFSGDQKHIFYQEIDENGDTITDKDGNPIITELK